jgi:hypothetical protein
MRTPLDTETHMIDELVCCQACTYSQVPWESPSQRQRLRTGFKVVNVDHGLRNGFTMVVLPRAAAHKQ